MTTRTSEVLILAAAVAFMGLAALWDAGVLGKWGRRWRRWRTARGRVWRRAGGRRRKY